jgi:hypothetical protein
MSPSKSSDAVTELAREESGGEEGVDTNPKSQNGSLKIGHNKFTTRIVNQRYPSK